VIGCGVRGPAFAPPRRIFATANLRSGVGKTEFRKDVGGFVISSLGERARRWRDEKSGDFTSQVDDMKSVGATTCSIHWRG
jgi:hypothetical protein